MGQKYSIQMSLSKDFANAYINKSSLRAKNQNIFYYFYYLDILKVTFLNKYHSTTTHIMMRREKI